MAIVCATVYQLTLEGRPTSAGAANAAVHPEDSPDKKPYALEQTGIPEDENDALKLDRIHANNIRNGGAFELRPIPPVDDNEHAKSLTPNPQQQPATPSPQITASALSLMSVTNNAFHQRPPQTIIEKLTNGNRNGNDKNHNTKITNNNNPNSNNHNHRAENQHDLKTDDGRMCNADENAAGDVQSLGKLLCFHCPLWRMSEGNIP